MLYHLRRRDLRRLRKIGSSFNPTFTGAEMLIASYRTDPDVVARILPRPLAAPREPRAVAFVARYPQTNFGPAYNEGALFIQAKRGRERGLYCLAMPVDDDMAMVGGRERFGFPKKMAERISLEVAGAHWTGSVVRKGTELLHIEADLDTEVRPGDLAAFGNEQRDDHGRPRFDVVSLLFKSPPSPDGKGFDYLPRLVRQVTEFKPRADLRRGKGRIVVRSSLWDPLGDVLVLDNAITCFGGTFDNTMLPGRVVQRVWNAWRFVPYSLFKSDVVPVLLGWTGANSGQVHSAERAGPPAGSPDLFHLAG